MKRLLISGAVILIVAFIASAAFSINLSYGVIGGANLSNFIGDDKGDAKSRLGFHGGVFARLPILGLITIEPEALISLKGAKEDASPDDLFYNFYYLEIPVLMRVDIPFFPLGFNAFGGAYSALNVSAKLKQGDTSTDIKDDTDTFDYGLVFGAGIDIARILVDLRYSFGLTTTDEDGSSDKKNSTFSLMAGLRLK